MKNKPIAWVRVNAKGIVTNEVLADDHIPAEDARRMTWPRAEGNGGWMPLGYAGAVLADDDLLTAIQDIAAKCSDHETTDALDALVSDARLFKVLQDGMITEDKMAPAGEAKGAWGADPAEMVRKVAVLKKLTQPAFITTQSGNGYYKLMLSFSSADDMNRAHDAALGLPQNKSAEQQARDMLERMGIVRAQSMTAGELVELASLIAAHNAIQPSSQPKHADDVMVDALAVAMKAKMAAARAKGRSGWDDPAQCSVENLQEMLCAHVAKGDPVDVANFCGMLLARGAGTAVPAIQASQLIRSPDQLRAAVSRRLMSDPELLELEAQAGGVMAAGALVDTATPDTVGAWCKETVHLYKTGGLVNADGFIELHTNAAIDMQPAEQSLGVAQRDDAGVHLSHCNQGEYKGECKYGEEETCPALKPAQDANPPYRNCQYKVCDLPGQCKGEGKCHHPVTAGKLALAVGSLTPSQAAQAKADIAAGRPTGVDLIDSMCLTWRHDFGLDKPASGVGSGMHPVERDFLRAQMRSLIEHHGEAIAALSRQQPPESWRAVIDELKDDQSAFMAFKRFFARLSKRFGFTATDSFWQQTEQLEEHIAALSRQNDAEPGEPNIASYARGYEAGRAHEAQSRVVLSRVDDTALMKDSLDAMELAAREDVGVEAALAGCILRLRARLGVV